MSGRIFRFSLIGLLFVSQLALAQERAERPGNGRSTPDVYLRNARAAAEAEHDAIWALGPQPARERYASLAPEMRADVWTIHFERFLADHPDLTPLQRAVVIDALDLVAGGIIEASIAYQQNADLYLSTHAPLVTLERRAIVAFGLEQERALLELPASPQIVNVQPSASKHAIVNGNGNCNCVDIGDCQEGYSCVPKHDSHCAFSLMCGTLADQVCTGLCLQP